MRVQLLLRVAFFAALSLLLLIPGVAGAGREPPGPGDGTFSVRSGKGFVRIIARGTIIGSVANGQVRVVDRSPFDDRYPVVRGGKLKQSTFNSVTRQGKNVRFRLGGGMYRLRITGRRINLSAVGRGAVVLDGDERYADTGLYSLNGEEFLPVPYERIGLPLMPEPVEGRG